MPFLISDNYFDEPAAGVRSRILICYFKKFSRCLNLILKCFQTGLIVHFQGALAKPGFFKLSQIFRQFQSYSLNIPAKHYRFSSTASNSLQTSGEFTGSLENHTKICQFRVIKVDYLVDLGKWWNLINVSLNVALIQPRLRTDTFATDCVSRALV